MDVVSNLTGICALAGVAVITLAATAQERHVQRKQLPMIVLATIDRNTSGATIKAYLVDRQHGHKVYEAETIVVGHTRDIEVTQDGTLSEVEEEVAFDSLTVPVKHALLREAKGDRIARVEALSRGGTLVLYEASVKIGGKTKEIQVGPTGDKIQHLG